MRLLIASLGDYNLQKPSAEVFTGFEPAFVPVDPALPLRIEKAVAPLFPSASADLNVEVTTLLAMIQAREATLPQRLLTAITPQSRADMDFQYLATLARLGEAQHHVNYI